MATSAGEVEVKLSLNADDFKKAIGDSQKNLGQFNSTLETIGSTLLAVFSFSRIAQFFENSLKAYGDSQLATAKLVATLGAHGIASEELVAHLDSQSRALEALSGIQQVTITSAQTMLATYGLSGPILDKATKAAVDFAVRTGSLEVATNLLAKAHEGNTTMLKRYGITVDQTLAPAQQFEALLNKISVQFGPVAAAQAGTYVGQMAALTNAFTHLEEEVGKIIAAPGGGIVGWLTQFTNSTKEAIVSIEKATEDVGNFRGVLAGVILEILRSVSQTIVEVTGHLMSLLSLIPAIGPVLSMLKLNVEGINKAIDTQINQWQQLVYKENQALSGVISNEKTKTDLYKNTAQVHMDVSAVMEAWIRKQNDLSKDAFLANLKEEDQGFMAFVDSFVTTEKDLWGFATQMSNTFFTGVGDNFAKMIVEGKNFTDSMKTLFRDMAEQMISYIVQIIAKLLVMLALETATGTGPAAGAAVSFMGAMAGGGVIGEPSIIYGLQSGSRTLAGEAGPEMVSPMNGGSGGGSNESAGGGQGGNITINISGQLIEGNESSWRQLVNQQIIPAIRRFTMSSPSGPFNRTRGVV